MRAWALILAFGLAALALAGCFSGPSEGSRGFTVDVVETDREEQIRAKDQVWVAWAHGNETRRAIEGEPSYGVCDVAFDHGIDPANRTLVYDGETYPRFEPSQAWGVMVMDHWDTSTQCPIAYRLHPEPTRSTAIDLGPPGNLTLAISEGGTLVVGDRTVGQGEAALVNYTYASTADGTTYRHTGQLTVELLGAWPAGNITAADR